MQAVHLFEQPPPMQQLALFLLTVSLLLLSRCVAGEELIAKLKKEVGQQKKQIEDTHAAMVELTQENQSLQVCTAHTSGMQFAWMAFFWRWTMLELEHEWLNVVLWVDFQIWKWTVTFSRFCAAVAVVRFFLVGHLCLMWRQSLVWNQDNKDGGLLCKNGLN